MKAEIWNNGWAIELTPQTDKETFAAGRIYDGLRSVGIKTIGPEGEIESITVTVDDVVAGLKLLAEKASTEIERV